MQSISQYVSWLGIASVAIVGVSLVVSALLQSRPRRVRPAMVLVVALVEILAGLALILPTNVLLEPAWMIGMAVVGLIGGWFAGGMTKIRFRGDVRAAKLSPIAAWITAVVYTGAMAALFFATVSYFAVAAQLVTFAMAFIAGSALHSFMKIVRAPVSVGAAVTDTAPPDQPA